ncbi:DUF3047 domain-containing protein [Oceaniglobus ichthyenteri]|uniref:DUF3047 domain-containing protein n=1 Tax=Oceaniglobus ichthyenteri TaxID=2136177 RepID=UPI001F0C485F|nr:DUF3047 domain-containing protein [Oceaniglobus ichthyenteri]
MVFRLSMTAVLVAGCLAGAAHGGQLAFSGWTEQKFSLFSKVNFRQAGNTLAFRSDDAASLIWQRVPQADWSTQSAAWRWDVTASVPPTDLTRKGGDDRNASMYFVFLPRDVTEANAGSGNIRKLLANPDARVLMFVWGGAHTRGQILASPYLGARGKTVILRGAGTGSFNENVDLARDFSRAFGGAPGALVGVAVSADSDDTNTQSAGQISGLTLR